MRKKITTWRRNRWVSKVVQLGKEIDNLYQERGVWTRVADSPRYDYFTDRITTLTARKQRYLTKIKETANRV